MKIKQYSIVLLSIFIISLKGYSQCYNPTSPYKCLNIEPGGSEFLMTTLNNVTFSFNKLSDYLGGITMSGTTQLKLKIKSYSKTQTDSCRWKLVMSLDNNGSIGNNWELKTPYGNGHGTVPDIGLIQIRVYNPCSTPQLNNNYQTFTNINELRPIIYSDLIHEPGSHDQVNTDGSYIDDYCEYSFTFDYRIKPTLSNNFNPGIYELKVKFCLVEY